LPFIRKTYTLKEPIKLFLFLMRQFGYSIHQAQRVIDNCRVRQNGKVIREKGAVVEGEIEVIIFQPETRGLKPIFETAHFALYDKPSGLMVHPKNRKSDYTLIDEIRYRFGPEANIAHRLDKETSGLILVTKNRESERSIKILFQEREMKKGYLALVRGSFKGRELIDLPIHKNRNFSTIKLKVSIDPRGKPAQTLVEEVENLGEMTLVRALPLTGRQHQIRAHLSHIGHPIVGDPIYGSSSEIAASYLNGELSLQERLLLTGAPRLMLHAQELQFTYRETDYILSSPAPFSRLCREIAEGFTLPS